MNDINEKTYKEDGDRQSVCACAVLFATIPVQRRRQELGWRDPAGAVPIDGSAAVERRKMGSKSGHFPYVEVDTTCKLFK